MTTKTNYQSPSNAALAEIEAFEARFNYDATYMKEMLNSHPEAFAVFHGFLPMASYRMRASLEAMATVALTAFRYADCGPCFELTVRKLEESGVQRQLIRDILDPHSHLPEDLKRARSFAQAVLTNDPTAETLRLELEASMGKPALIELALAIAAAQVFPIVKRSLGHYRSCSVLSADLCPEVPLPSNR